MTSCFRFYLIICLLFSFQILIIDSAKGQYLFNSDSAFNQKVPNSGRLWGYTFGDYFHKSHSDSLNRGGNNQYTNVKSDQGEFQFRRIYLGYDYNISKDFSTEFLLAAEDDLPNGDLLQNNKFSPYIKLANIRWKNFLFKGNDLIIGMQSTPAFPFTSENLFSYSRPIERTITDIRRTPSFDFGAGLQGRFLSTDSTIVYGYNLLVANGSSDKIQTLNTPVYKNFYGDFFVGLFKNKLVIDIYADYQRQNWVPGIHGHASRQMSKASIIWVDKKFTIGVEGFLNALKQSETGIIGTYKDTSDGKANGLSFYAHANISGSMLKVFARYDLYNPNSKYDNLSFTKYATLYGLSTSYEPNNKERFISVGLDYSPVSNVHFMPNIWYNKYIGKQANLIGSAAQDYDLVYRLTFYYIFGKFSHNTKYTYYPYH